MLVTCRPRRSIPAAERITTLTRSAARSTLGNISSRRSSVICLESCRPPSARRSAMRERLVVDQDRGGDQRPGQAAAPGLVGAGDVAALEAAVEGEQAAAAGQPAAAGTRT